MLNLKKLPISKREVQRVCYEYELMTVKNKQGDIEDLELRTLDNELRKKLLMEKSSPMLEFSLVSYLRLFFLEPTTSENDETVSKMRPFNVSFNSRKIDFIKVKQTINSIRADDQQRFVSISKNKMFEGVTGCNSANTAGGSASKESKETLLLPSNYFTLKRVC